MLRVEFHPEAARELEESILWYDAQSQGLGAEFLREIERGIVAVRERPAMWPLFSGTTRRFLVHRFPYGLLYVYDKTVVRILAVMHLHRKPGYAARRGRKAPG